MMGTRERRGRGRGKGKTVPVLVDANPPLAVLQGHPAQPLGARERAPAIDKLQPEGRLGRKDVAVALDVSRVDPREDARVDLIRRYIGVQDEEGAKQEKAVGQRTGGLPGAECERRPVSEILAQRSHMSAERNDAGQVVRSKVIRIGVVRDSRRRFEVVHAAVLAHSMHALQAGRTDREAMRNLVEARGLINCA